MALRRLKNVTNDLIFINGTGLPINEYYEIPNNEYLQYISDHKLLENIAAGNIIVNDGFNDIINIIDAWNYLIGRNEPPKTNEGFWTILSKKESELDDSEIFNVVFSRCVNPGSFFEEYIYVPENKIFKLKNFIADSPSCSLYTIIEYYVKFNNNYYVHNPMINSEFLYDFVVDEKFNIGDAFIKVNYNELYENIYYKDFNNKLMCYNDENKNKKYFVSENFDDSAMKLYASNLNSEIVAGTKLLNSSGPIISIGSENSPSFIDFEAPLEFKWEGKSYLKIISRNISNKEVGLINIVLNGYFRNKD